MIQMGDADVIIAGGAESAGNDMGIAGFAAAKALSTRNDAPEQASRPWDKDRDGFVLGDGAGVIILESLPHALARGATIYDEIIGMGMSSDAHMSLTTIFFASLATVKAWRIATFLAVLDNFLV